MLPLALSFDHRLIDGAAAAQFLNRLKTLLAEPNMLFLELI
jgi:pyruvate/2-oxoglutarate dehydrogenase complex dihydrolipoamide acyltransferase (E2) component